MDPYFFGYGSLVNRATHDFPDARPAAARGWRRLWRHLDHRQVAVLTAVPDPVSRIEGLVAAVPGADWHALDQREAAYDRIAANGHVDHDLHPGAEVAIYHIPEEKHDFSPAARPILLSYLDVVIQGYLREFGTGAADRFFDTTDGWGPVRDDRGTPVYPRAQPITERERDIVDAALRALGCDVVPD